MNVGGTTNLLSLFAQNANVGTMNVLSSFVTPGDMNVGGTTNLSSLFAPNANVGTMNVTSFITPTIVTGSITYNEDLTKQAPYLMPSPANAAAILAWIAATCNVTGTGSFWSPVKPPSFSYIDFNTINAVGILGVAKNPVGPFTCGILLPSGDAIFIPSNLAGSTTQTLFGISSKNFPGVGTFTYSTSAISTTSYRLLYAVLSPAGRIVAVSNSNPGYIASIDINTSVTTAPQSNTYNIGCGGCVLGPDSSVIMIPGWTGSTSSTNSISTYNDYTNIITNKITIGSDPYIQNGEFAGAVLLPNGVVVCIPWTNSFICAYDAITNTIQNRGCISGITGFNGGVLTPTGNVVCIPYSQYPSSNIGIYTPATSTTSATFTNVITNTGQTAFCGGCLLPTGNVIMAPFSSSNIGMFSPSTFTYSNLVTLSGFLTGGPQCRGCVLRPDGKVVFVMNNSDLKRIVMLNMNTPAPIEMCLSPFFNKF